MIKSEMMSNPKVSVIIPVYNTEKYINDSVLAIQNQTLRDIEIIVIDDGSTDSSAWLIGSLAAKDERIKLFTQENHGQSVARNSGLDRATGEFVYFMDSDDLLEPNTLLACYDKCVSQNLQLITFDADVFYEDDRTENKSFNYQRAGELDEKVYKGIDLMEILLEKNLFRAVPWLFFVRRELIERINLRFLPGIIHEDELFSPILYLAADRIGYTPQVFFHRRIRANSTMTNNFSERNLKGYFSVIDNLELYKANKDKQTIKIVDRLIENVVISVGDQSVNLPVKARYTIVGNFFRKGLVKFTTLKCFLLLISPFSNNFKTKILKPFFNSINKSYCLLTLSITL